MLVCRFASSGGRGSRISGAEVVQVYVSRYHPEENPDAVRVCSQDSPRILKSRQRADIVIQVSAKSLAEVVVSSDSSSATWMWTLVLLESGWGTGSYVDEIDSKFKPHSKQNPTRRCFTRS